MADVPSLIIRLSAKQIAAACGVDLATARRWRRGAICPPRSALFMLRLMETGDLGMLDPAWSGWVLVRGQLCSPENWIATPGDVRAMQLKEAQVSALRREAFELRQRLAEIESGAGLEDQPLPESWSIQTG